MMLHIGFTGTRNGMNKPQTFALWELTEEPYFDTAPNWTIHHGDCIGADAQFHESMTNCVGVTSVGHPGTIISTMRAWCRFDVCHDPKPPLLRNQDIVNAADVMIAAPFEFEEQLRSGTWSTIRLARKANKPLAIIWPDGTVTKERWPDE